MTNVDNIVHLALHTCEFFKNVRIIISWFLGQWHKNLKILIEITNLPLIKDVLIVINILTFIWYYLFNLYKFFWDISLFELYTWIGTLLLQMTDTQLKISLSKKRNLLIYIATEYRGGVDFRDSSNVIR